MGETTFNSGYVYFFRDDVCGLIKIGKCSDVYARLSNFTGSSAHPISPLGVIASKRVGDDELAIHEMFAKERAHHEWFNPSPELLAFIEKHASRLEPRVERTKCKKCSYRGKPIGYCKRHIPIIAVEEKTKDPLPSPPSIFIDWTLVGEAA